GPLVIVRNSRPNSVANEPCSCFSSVYHLSVPRPAAGDQPRRVFASQVSKSAGAGGCRTYAVARCLAQPRDCHPSVAPSATAKRTCLESATIASSFSAALLPGFGTDAAIQPCN